MSNDKPNKNTIFDDEEFERLQADFNNLKTSAGSIFNAVYTASNKKVAAAIQERQEKWDAMKQAEEEKSKREDYNYPPVYETREKRRHRWGCHRKSEKPEPAAAPSIIPQVFTPVTDAIESFSGFGFDDFFEQFAGLTQQGKTPFGYYSRLQPSTRYYSDCITKQGLSVYDTKGNWQCLFPNSEVPVLILSHKQDYYPNEILTKEDFEKVAVRGKDGVYDLGAHGIYFKNFDNLMNWKVHMNEISKSNKIESNRIDDIAESKRRADIAESKRYVDVAKSRDSINSVATPSERIVSTSVESHYTTNPKTNEAEWNEVRTKFFDDGTSFTQTVNKKKPVGSNTWVDVNSETSDLKGWFWRKH